MKLHLNAASGGPVLPVKKEEKKAGAEILAARGRAGLLCKDTVETLERAQSNRVFELENWRSLKLELDKLGYFIQKLMRELARMQEPNKNS